MLAAPSEPETIGNNGPRTNLDHQISLPHREVEEPSKADRVEPPSHMPELNKQNSIFSLTLDEIQSKSGRSFGSMNMEELIANIWSVEENGRLTVSSPQANQLDSNDDHGAIISDNAINEGACNDGDKDSKSDLSRQGSFSIPIPLCKKTVDEIWLEMHKEECAEQLDQPEKGTVSRGEGGANAPQRQQTLGEMTLEDFLVKAGIVKESLQQVEIKQALEYKSAESNNGDIAMINSSGTNGDLLRMSNGLTAFAAYQAYGQSNVAVGQHHEVASYGNNGDYYSVNAHEKRTGNLTETSGGGAKSKKRIVDGPPEVVVERRQRRMIKNRESARSRARKQVIITILLIQSWINYHI